jgi:hypothetical protein
MRNLVKVLGIIAMLAVVGLFVSCDVAPEDQTIITIAGMADSYNGNYALVGVYEDSSMEKLLGVSSALKTIKSGKVELALVSPEEGKKGEAVIVKQGVILLGIFSDDKAETSVYSGRTDRVVSLGKGPFTIDADKFIPDLTAGAPTTDPEKPAANDFGTYTTKYTSGSPAKDVTETIELAEGKFLIYDNDVGTTAATRDFIEFNIKKWESASVPTEAAYATYTGAYKFTGKIIGAKGYIPANAQSKTAPGFGTADVVANETGPDVWMFIYFKTNADGSITFIRTPFSKEGNVNAGIVTGANNSPRVYTKS